MIKKNVVSLIMDSRARLAGYEDVDRAGGGEDSGGGRADGGGRRDGEKMLTKPIDTWHTDLSFCGESDEFTIRILNSGRNRNYDFSKSLGRSWDTEKASYYRPDLSFNSPLSPGMLGYVFQLGFLSRGAKINEETMLEKLLQVGTIRNSIAKNRCFFTDKDFDVLEKELRAVGSAMFSGDPSKEEVTALLKVQAYLSALAVVSKEVNHGPPLEKEEEDKANLDDHEDGYHQAPSEQAPSSEEDEHQEVERPHDQLFHWLKSQWWEKAAEPMFTERNTGDQLADPNWDEIREFVHHLFLKQELQGKKEPGASLAEKSACFWARLRLHDAYNVWMNVTPFEDDVESSKDEIFEINSTTSSTAPRATTVRHTGNMGRMDKPYRISNPLSVMNPFTMKLKQSKAGGFRGLDGGFSGGEPENKVYTRLEMYFGEAVWFNTVITHHAAAPDDIVEKEFYSKVKSTPRSASSSSLKRKSIETRVAQVEICDEEIPLDHNTRDILWKDVHYLKQLCWGNE
ncbi:unnamed protein product [Amoebophrya sp. A25]|nr:unnamed protein product [Amoebophrya sp. A25]|eukprot:GSA25T00008531001.1